MKIILTQGVPAEDGFYLVKFGENERIHFVEVLTIGHQRVIQTDNCPFGNFKKDLKCRSDATRLYFNEFPRTAFWSERIIG